MGMYSLAVLGCLIGAAHLSVSTGCNVFTCGKACPNGYKRNMNGCSMCQCVPRPPPIQMPIIMLPVICQSKMCSTKCSAGFQKDMRGCPTCKCNPAPMMMPRPRPPSSTCPAFMCGKACPMGYGRDMYGCNTCQCAMPVQVMCPGMNCRTTCPNGYRKDPQGCPTCKCRPLSIPCPKGIYPVKCPMSPCSQAMCLMYPSATCVESYCGGCYAAFYMNGKKVSC